MTLQPAIYSGTLRHRRSTPRKHEFQYNVFQAWLDIDRIPETMAATAWTAHNRFHWASFHDADYLEGTRGRTLREQLTASARAQGIVLPGGPVFLLTNLRYLGYCFNPISLYYCFDESPTGGGSGEDVPRDVLAEVTSTFGERRHYWLGAHNAVASEVASKNSMRFACGKSLHVSPFMPMDLDYDFTLTPPAERLVTHIGVSRAGHEFFDATLKLERKEWSSAALFGQLARHPWMTAKVMVAIHWEAVRLWWKGVPVHTHPGRVAEPKGVQGS